MGRVVTIHGATRARAERLPRWRVELPERATVTDAALEGLVGLRTDEVGRRIADVDLVTFPPPAARITGVDVDPLDTRPRGLSLWLDLDEETSS